MPSESDLIPSHHCAIQDKDEDFYLQFQIVICGLDSVEARRWINATLVNMVDWDDPQRSLKPLIDGGTEGKRSIFKVPFFTYLQDSVGKHV
jgi:ubiquitin-activating enzyme E1 C